VPGLFGQCLKIAIWHHPVSSSGDDRITDHGFLQRLAQSGFFLGLHGHIHKADTGLYRYDSNRSLSGRKIEIISAGTFGAPIRQWTPGYPLQYNLIRLDEDRLVVETRARTEPNGAWRPDAIWTQGPGQDPLPRYDITLPTYNKQPVDKPVNLPNTQAEKKTDSKFQTPNPGIEFTRLQELINYAFSPSGLDMTKPSAVQWAFQNMDRIQLE